MTNGVRHVLFAARTNKAGYIDPRGMSIPLKPAVDQTTHRHRKSKKSSIQSDGTGPRNGKGHGLDGHALRATSGRVRASCTESPSHGHLLLGASVRFGHNAK